MASILASSETKANHSRMSENTTTKKRERRPNFTPDEKALLAELISQYLHIVEDKRTGGIFYKRKREAWKVITIKYNRRCSTGPRTTENLKMLYDNMKQQARKNDGECFTNTVLKMRLFQNNGHSQDRRGSLDEEDAVEALQSMREEKIVQMDDDGGNFYKPRTDDPDQVEPLSNPYDSAAAYFRDCAPPPAVAALQFLHLSRPDSRAAGNKHSVNNTSEPNSWGSQPSTSFTASPEPDKIKFVGDRAQRPPSLGALRRLHLRRRCRNARLERERILQDIAHARQKHHLEMIILRRTLDNQNNSVQ